MLKLYVRHGMIIEKIHDVISFIQSKWFKKYINFHTQKRNQAVNALEKDFYKVLKNAFYGKAMENVPYRVKLDFF